MVQSHEPRGSVKIAIGVPVAGHFEIVFRVVAMLVSATWTRPRWDIVESGGADAWVVGRVNHNVVKWWSRGLAKTTVEVASRRPELPVGENLLDNVRVVEAVEENLRVLVC